MTNKNSLPNEMNELNLKRKNSLLYTFFKFFGAYWVFCLFLTLAFWGVVGYIVYHFLCKVW